MVESQPDATLLMEPNQYLNKYQIYKKLTKNSDQEIGYIAIDQKSNQTVYL